MHRLSDTQEFNSLSWSTDPFLLLPVLDLGPAEQEVAVDIGIRFTPKLEGLPSLLAPPAPAEPAQTRQQPESPEAGAGPLKGIEVLQGDLITPSIRAPARRKSLAAREEGGRNLAALEAAGAGLASNYRTYWESLLAQTDEIRRPKAVT